MRTWRRSPPFIATVAAARTRTSSTGSHEAGGLAGIHGRAFPYIPGALSKTSCLNVILDEGDAVQLSHLAESTQASPDPITLYEKGPRRQSGYMGRAGASSRSSGLMAGSSSAHLSMAFSE